jgi:proteasome lid subunit RPN8/RPN11
MDFNFIKETPEPVRDVESESSIDFVINLAKKGNWYMIYLLSKRVSREVSILVDSKDTYFVDWGTIGSVELSPPVGAVLPFKLWVHTHPSNTAYWSITDRNTLEIARGILDKALVLGENGLISTTLQPTTSSTVDIVNPNPQWTEEEVMGWLEYNSDNFDSDFVEDFYSPEFKFRWNGRKVFTDTFDSDGKYW